MPFVLLFKKNVNVREKILFQNYPIEDQIPYRRKALLCPLRLRFKLLYSWHRLMGSLN
jgi:hypothetical protein